MKNNASKSITHYMGLPYTLIVKRDKEGDFVSRIEELQGCVAHGKTENEAIQQVKKMQELWIQDCLDAGDTVPLPKEDEDLPSGKWVQRVPRSLHKKLTEKARREEVSLNQLVTSMLAEAIGNGQMTGIIDESLLAHFASHQILGTCAAHSLRSGENKDPMRGQHGKWLIDEAAIKVYPPALQDVANMTSTESSYLDYDDNEKETANFWHRAIR